MPAVSGAWKDVTTSFSVPTPLHVADPRHARRGHEPGPQEYAHEAPPYPYTPPYGKEDFGSQEVPDIRGLQIDTTPIDHAEGMDVGIAFTRVPDLDEPGGADWDILARTHATHNLDKGASKKQNYSERVLEFYDEKYLFFRIPGLGPEATDPIPALAGGGQRGLNGLSINNPPDDSYLGRGFWPGTTEQWVVDRKFQARVIQRNDERAQSVNLPFFEPNAPPPRPGNVNTTPFTSLQRMVSKVMQLPMPRRTPPVPGDVMEERMREDHDSPTVEAGFYG